MNRPKWRHGCVTAWLILMTVANALNALVTPLSAAVLQPTTPGFPVWVVWPIALLSILNVIFALALLSWKKWGFFGFVATSLIAFGLNLYAGGGVLLSVLGLLGVAILYGVLQIGGQDSVWSQLEERQGNVLIDRRQRYATECSICGSPLSGRQRFVGLCRGCAERAA